MNKKGKFIVFDATDIMCIGGFGNDKGNIELLKYSEEEISNMIIENNNSEDNIRLVNSLLGTIRKQKEVIDKTREYIQKMFETGFYNDDYYLGHLNQILQDKEVE